MIFDEGALGLLSENGYRHTGDDQSITFYQSGRKRLFIAVLGGVLCLFSLAMAFVSLA